MYRIIDLQGDNYMLLTNKVYKTKEAIVKHLADFHSIDFTGCIDKNGEDIPVSIYDVLKNFKTTEKKLNYLLDYGSWDIKKIKSKKI